MYLKMDMWTWCTIIVQAVACESYPADSYALSNRDWVLRSGRPEMRHNIVEMG